VRILAVCGLRPGEALALRIDDFEGKQLRIDEALKERQLGEDRIGDTKTDESDSYVPIPPDLSREIAEWIAVHPQRDNRRAFLFLNRRGRAFSVGNYLKKQLKSLFVDHIPWPVAGNKGFDRVTYLTCFRLILQ